MSEVKPTELEFETGYSGAYKMKYKGEVWIQEIEFYPDHTNIKKLRIVGIKDIDFESGVPKI